MDLNKIEYLGLDRVLCRGSGEVIADLPDALFIRDRVSGACFLACESPETGTSTLERYMKKDCNLLVVPGPALGNAVFERYGFSGKMECYQVAYYGKKPEPQTELTFQTATSRDLPLLTRHYHLISPEELAKVVERGAVILGYHSGKPVGFIGEHLEGSMGILYVLPAFRRHGYGEALQKHLIAKTMERGFTPFGQVEKSNVASLQLQKKLGMRQSERLIVWMWK